MSSKNLNNLANVLLINNSDSFNNADAVTKKLAELAELVNYGPFNPDEREEMLKHLFVFKSYYDLSNPKHVAEGAVASTKPRRYPADRLTINHLTLSGDYAVYNDYIEEAYTIKGELTPLNLAYALRKLRIDTSALKGLEEVKLILSKLKELGASIVETAV